MKRTLIYPNYTQELRWQQFKNKLKLLGIAAALIACIPLPPAILAELEKQAVTHDFGYKYLYLADIFLFNWRLFEACLFWLPPAGKTGAHCHQEVFNRGRVVRGSIIEEKSRVTRNEIKPVSRRNIPAGGWLKGSFKTPPFAIHELINASEQISVALSLYLPGRDY